MRALAASREAGRAQMARRTPSEGTSSENMGAPGGQPRSEGRGSRPPSIARGSSVGGGSWEGGPPDSGADSGPMPGSMAGSPMGGFGHSSAGGRSLDSSGVVGPRGGRGAPGRGAAAAAGGAAAGGDPGPGGAAGSRSDESSDNVGELGTSGSSSSGRRRGRSGRSRSRGSAARSADGPAPAPSPFGGSSAQHVRPAFAVCAATPGRACGVCDERLHRGSLLTVCK
jgi:hypothetical protein